MFVAPQYTLPAQGFPPGQQTTTVSGKTYHVLIQLHWLPVHYRIQYKTLLTLHSKVGKPKLTLSDLISTFKVSIWVHTTELISLFLKC